jgi:hypothetical protein
VAKRAKTNLKLVTPTVEKSTRYSRMLLRAIETEIPEADYFTREDLLQLRVFQHVATISRYQEVCTGVHLLLASGQILARSRTVLCLPGRGKTFHEDETLGHQYETTIRRMVRNRPAGESFAVMDVVWAWKTDPQLTINNKRVAVRSGLKKLVHDKVLKLVNDFEYVREA